MANAATAAETDGRGAKTRRDREREREILKEQQLKKIIGVNFNWFSSSFLTFKLLDVLG